MTQNRIVPDNLCIDLLFSNLPGCQKKGTPYFLITSLKVWTSPFSVARRSIINIPPELMPTASEQLNVDYFFRPRVSYRTMASETSRRLFRISMLCF